MKEPHSATLSVRLFCVVLEGAKERQDWKCQD